MKKITLFIWIILIFSLSGCNPDVSLFETPPSLSKEHFRGNTITSLPSYTSTIAKILTPTITPTIGPPPDLELVDISITPKTFNKWGQKYYLLGRIRNNTDQIMLLHGPKNVFFRFQFEFWQYDEIRLQIDNRPYRHIKYIDEADLSIFGGVRTVNCILYPGEEGVFIYYTESNRGMEATLLDEIFEQYSGPLGIWYSYESFYDTRPDLPLNLHPKAENIKFVRDQASFKFEYDIVDIPDNISDVHSADLNTWIILYDKDGKVLNILFRMVNQLEDFTWKKNEHIRGNSTDTAEHYYFNKSVEMTQEIIDAVDHIEIINEFEEGSICRLGEY